MTTMEYLKQELGATWSASPGLTMTMPAGTNFDVLLPGTVWDVATKSTASTYRW